MRRDVLDERRVKRKFNGGLGTSDEDQSVLSAQYMTRTKLTNRAQRVRAGPRYPNAQKMYWMINNDTTVIGRLYMPREKIGFSVWFANPHISSMFGNYLMGGKDVLWTYTDEELVNVFSQPIILRADWVQVDKNEMQHFHSGEIPYIEGKFDTETYIAELEGPGTWVTFELGGVGDTFSLAMFCFRAHEVMVSKQKIEMENRYGIPWANTTLNTLYGITRRISPMSLHMPPDLTEWSEDMVWNMANALRPIHRHFRKYAGQDLQIGSPFHEFLADMHAFIDTWSSRRRV
jgi:hypothetical protein